MKKIMAVLAVLAVLAFAAPSFAANPFTDVPAGHWAYDAVARLAARGIVFGYPDGTYKGVQPMTRYEMAAMLARVLAQVDMEKASKHDMELLKKLVLEFKNELDALGVKVSDLDKRVAVLEDGVGGWKIRGIFRFDAKFADDDDYGKYNFNKAGKNEFTKERFRLFLTKTIDENTYFYAQYRTGDNGAGSGKHGRGAQEHMRWSHLYVDTKVFWDMGLRVGRFAVDFEDEHGLYTDNDALFGDFFIDGFRFSKSFGVLNATAVIGRNFEAVGHERFGSELSAYADTSDHMGYIFDLNLQPGEKFFIGATGYWLIEDNDGPLKGVDSKTYGIYAGYSFTPAIALKGVYYFQDNDLGTLSRILDDSPKAWKAILDVKQDALKFTSLWVEYSQTDNTFFTSAHPRYSIGNTGAHVMYNRMVDNDKTKVWFVKAEQKWNDKWSTFLRYAQADFGTTWGGLELDDAKEYGIGVSYQYTPAINFELAYDLVDYGSGNPDLRGITTAGGVDIVDGNLVKNFRNGKESVIRFRTTVTF